MKPNILTKTIAALLLALPLAQADDKKNDEKKEGRKGGATNSSSTIVTAADGTATVTIDINGKKETRTFKLGDGNNTFTFGDEGDGAKAGGGVVIGAGGGGFGAPGQPRVLNAKREKGPWLGLAMEPVQDVVRAQLSLAPGEGVVVNHVAPESPAAKAGLQENDILLRFEDQIIVEPSQLRKLIAMKKTGDTVKLKYLRKGELKEAKATLIEHEIEAGEHSPMQFFQMQPGAQGWPVAPGGKPGARVQDFMKELKEKHPGVIVDKRSWTTGEAGEAVQGQLDKLLREVEKSGIPNEQLEHLRKELDRVRHEAEEAMENAKRNPGNKLEKQRENPKGEEKKKPEPL